MFYLPNASLPEFSDYLINHIVFCQLSAACTHCYEGKHIFHRF